MARAEPDPDVLAVILFGSQARGTATPGSDADVCLVLQPPAAARDGAASAKRLEYLAVADPDLSVFQQLPVHIRSRVLREGEVLFTRDLDALYEVAIRTAKAFADFHHHQRAYLDAVAGVDRNRILSRLDELEGYLGELRSVAPGRIAEYRRVEKRRSCERLLQASVEAAIDVCALLVSGLRLGLPAEENDLFDKLAGRGVLSSPMADLLRRMRGLRNILVHEYGRVDDAIIFDAVRHRLGDFDAFRREILAFLRAG